MAYAAFRVFELPRQRAGRSAALVVFVLHMALNALWSVAFFGGRSPVAGVAELTLFWADGCRQCRSVLAPRPGAPAR